MRLTNCDPVAFGLTYWEVNEAQGPNGEVLVTFRYTWDGISQAPNCIGPVTYVKGTNIGAVTYYVHLKGRKGTPINLTLTPGQPLEESRPNILRNLGFNTNQDLEGLLIDTSPTPPPDF